MAMHVNPERVGVDVSKTSLEVCRREDGQIESIPNERRAILAWLRTLPPGSALAVEATSTYHVEVIQQAQARGHVVYLIDGFRLSRYRAAIGGRAKTDAKDAALLRRYLCHEQALLRAWTPPPAGYDEVRRLLRRRAKVVKSGTTLRQSLADLPIGQREVRALMARLTRIEKLIEQRLMDRLQALHWDADRRRCQRIEGVGPLTSAALAITYHRGEFRSSNAFVAFMGWDVRVRESGKMSGKRKLTKKGDPELRRLLYLAAQAAARSKTWKPFYQRCIARGMAPIQANVALARKLVRVAFSLMKHQTEYQPVGLATG